jgi:iron complex outermembrane recepter protein
VKFIHASLTRTVATFAMNSVFAAPAVADMRTRPVIPTESVENALMDFMAQTYIQVLYDSAVDGLSTRAVNGTLEAAEALKEMLGSTGLEVEVVDDMTMTVKSAVHNIDVPAPMAEIKVEAERPFLPSVLPPETRLGDAMPFITAGSFTLPEALKGWSQVAGGDCQDTLDSMSRISRTNSGRGCGLNLRYFGAGSVLVLLDDMRMPGSGTDGLFVDVLHLPVFLLEGVDPILDHSSTQFGNDAISGVLNFRLSPCVDGSDLRVQVAPRLGHSVAEQQYSYRGCHAVGPLRGTFGFEHLAQSRLPAQWRVQATSDLTRWGGHNNDSYFGSPGTIVDGTRTWAIPTHLSTADQLVEGTANLYDTLHNTDLLPEQKSWTTFGAIEWPISNTLTVTTYALWSHRLANATLPAIGTELQVPPTNPWYENPTGIAGDVNVMYGFQKGIGFPVQMDDVVDESFSFKVRREIEGWSEIVELGYVSERQRENLVGLVNPTGLKDAVNSNNEQTAIDPFGDQTTQSTWQSITAQSSFMALSDAKSADVSVSGPIYKVKAGEITSHSGVDFRQESLSTHEQAGGIPPSVSTSAQRNVVSVFQAICWPLIGNLDWRCNDANVEEGDLRLITGGRYEYYDDFGDDIEPSLDLEWSPLANLRLRMMWTEAMKPPGLRDIDESNNVSQIVGVRTTPSSNELSPALILSGRNGSLRAERAKSFSASAALSSTDDERSKIRIYYFDIRERHRIDQPVIGSPTLTDSNLHGLVTLTPTADERQAVCAKSQYVGAAGDCLTVPVVAIIDGRLGNLYDVDVRGFDFDARQHVNIRNGGWTVGVSGTYFIEYGSSQFGDRHSLLNGPDNPQRIRGRGFFSWEGEGLEVTASATYRGGYRDFSSGSARRIASWTTYDLQFAVSLDSLSMAGLSGVGLSLSAENVFNSMPPFVEDPVGFGFDVTNANVFGRSIRLTIAKHW